MKPDTESSGNVVCLRANGDIEVALAREDVCLQAEAMLGCSKLEVVKTVIPNLVMLVDEDGKCKKLPVNRQATDLYHVFLDFICGDVLLADMKNGALSPLKNSGYVERLLKMLI